MKWGKTRSEWFCAVAEAWADETCPVCGYSHGQIEVSDDGEVAIYCPRRDRTFAVARVDVPTDFAPEEDQGADLPF